MRPTVCEVDLGAVAHNVSKLRDRVGPTPLCAVVKADGYGHGAIEVARVALEAGATWLAVAMAEEAAPLRAADIDVPILVLSEPDPTSVDELVALGLVATAYTSDTIAALDAASAAAGVVTEVHLNLDTGMRRLGAEPEQIDALVDQVNASDNLRLGAVWTHCPVADEPDNPFTDSQLSRFDQATGAAGVPTHVANSATALRFPDREALMVRCGISIYGIDPDVALAGMIDLRPALSLKSSVRFVKPIEAGESVAYGHRWTAAEPTQIATVPIGYADGIRRDSGLRGREVLIRGQRYPIVGVVTMDNLLVDVGANSTVEVGDEVVLIGTQGDDMISTADVAETLETIPYEVVCAIGPRVPRQYVT